MSGSNLIKVSIGGPESPAGTAAARSVMIPHRAVPTLKASWDKQLDPAVSAANIALAKYAVSGEVAGGIPLAFRPCAGIGKLVNSLLGQELTPTQVAACVRIRYTGASASCKLVATTSADTLVAEVGDLGAESGDAAFGTAGSIDLTAAATDTVGELVTVINAYDDYEAEKVFGADATDAADIIDIEAAQAKDGWVYLWFSSADSGAYLHSWPVILTATPERPVYSVQIDQRQDHHLYAGCVTNEFSLRGATRGFVEAEASILGFTETGSQTPSALSSPVEKPALFPNGAFSIGAVDFPYLRNHAISMSNQHRADGYGQGSIYRQYHEKGTFKATGDVQIRLDSNSYALRAYINSETLKAISLYYTGADITADIPEFALLEMPYCSVDEFDWPENEGVLDAKLNFEVVKGTGAYRYGVPLTFSFVTRDSAAY